MNIAVERITLKDPTELALTLDDRDVPLIVSGALEGWRALAWTPSELARRLPQLEVEYKISTSNAHPDLRQPSADAIFRVERGTFAEFMRLISTGPEETRSRYLFSGLEKYLIRRRDGRSHIDPDLAPLLADLNIPPFFHESQLHAAWCWFSARGVRTWLHYDQNGCHNLNAQVTGSKRCWLYAPDELSRLHLFSLGGGNPALNCSEIDVDAPAPQFAGFAAVPTFEAVLLPGDLLFIPAWWFHTFLHVGDFNSNVNFWWKPANPRWNVVAARQAVLDAAATAALDEGHPNTLACLQAMDRAALSRRFGTPIPVPASPSTTHGLATSPLPQL